MRDFSPLNEKDLALFQKLGLEFNSSLAADEHCKFSKRRELQESFARAFWAMVQQALAVHKKCQMPTDVDNESRTITVYLPKSEFEDHLARLSIDVNASPQVRLNNPIMEQVACGVAQELAIALPDYNPQTVPNYVEIEIAKDIAARRYLVVVTPIIKVD